MQIHIVEKGDTLWKISRSYGVSFEELKRLNAHLANPEYIVPGMKIFIPDTKKMESINHPYSENRPVKKEMVKKEEMRPHPVPPKAQQVPPKAHQVPPKAQQVPPKAQPIPPKAQPVQPVPIVPPIQPVPPVRPQPIPSYSLPYHMMPVPDLDMTPSPQGWRLVESTSIHIQANFNERERPAPAPPVQPVPPVQQPTQPVAKEPSPIFEEMYACPPEQDFSYMHMHPFMYPQMHPQMQAHYGGCPCVQICYVPVYPCPPYPHHRF
ncbi:LysM peptidoglycan-binding domain-containing protein [Psychrobacillus soli]|uniref:LysM peptidoglycan-binding domain-containing protein n=1 Tax=Psychrobacillus soli TaxID=1543965 RepID=A0A544TBG7_9BACI|nr:LysM peptidoglycan-binding domain-containing protein [Psychrobacillus soli]TQR14812.1 LysM peptidoglycan-binding domain-containing protein [Psychrobacillus soli]